MKTIFIPAKSRINLNKEKISEISWQLPKNLVIAYSIQFKSLAEKTADFLSETHKILKLVQVLGCSFPYFPKSAQAVLLIGSGKFHALGLAKNSSIPIYILEQNNFTKISEADIKFFEKAKKAAYVNFLNSGRIGILISVKPGQQKLNSAIAFKKNLKNKKSYLFLANSINSSEFENFGLDFWINTACPRLDADFPGILNITDLH